MSISVYIMNLSCMMGIKSLHEHWHMEKALTTCHQGNKKYSICMFACMHEYVQYAKIYYMICLWVCVCMYVCMYLCMHVCMHVRMYVCMHVCMCVCVRMYVCRYVHMYVSSCIYVSL